MNDCQKRGHLKLSTICGDCGQVVNRATFKDPHEWISVKNRLPEDSYSKRVLAYGIPACGNCGETQQVQFCNYQAKNGFEFGEYDCPFDATHWMPLPSPPGEK